MPNFRLLLILLVDHDVTPPPEAHPLGKRLWLLVWLGGVGQGVLVDADAFYAALAGVEYGTFTMVLVMS